MATDAADDLPPRRTQPGHEAGATALETALSELAKIGGFSNMVSMELAGSPTDRQGELASMVHGKMCAHARSIGAIVQSPMFDHSGIVALCRMIVEDLTTYAYLKQAVSPEVWHLRDLVLRLHDTVARITLLRAWKDRTDDRDLRTGRIELEAAIEASPIFQQLPDTQKDALRTGTQIFVGGMRRAAKEAGWAEARFTALYSYLSAHVHGAPMGCRHANCAPETLPVGETGVARARADRPEGDRPTCTSLPPRRVRKIIAGAEGRGDRPVRRRSRFTLARARAEPLATAALTNSPSAYFSEVS